MNIRIMLTAAATAALAPAAAAQEFRGLWMPSPTEIWMVADTLAARWDGRAWTFFGMGGGGYHAVGGSSARDVWVVGENGAALRWDGARWTRTSVGQPVTLVAVVATGPADVWAFGQSDDDSRPPTAFRWNGTEWRAQAFPFPFRVTCAAAAGAEVVVTGYAMFDPRPDQRRTYGVLGRRRDGIWTYTGFDGRQANDTVVGNTGWTCVSAGRGELLLWGMGPEGLVIRRSSAGGAWTTVPAPATEASPDEIRIHMAGDGGIIGTFAEHGFGRVARGAWAVVSPPSSQANPGDQAQMNRTLEDMTKRIQAGQQITAADIERMQQMSQRAQAAGTQLVANAQLAAALNFERAVAIHAPTAADFWVLTRDGKLTRVTGQSPQVMAAAQCVNPALAGAVAGLPGCDQMRLPARLVSAGVGPTPVPGAAPAATPGRPPINLPSPIRRPKP